MTDLMEQVAAEMDHVHEARRREWRMRQAYYRFRTRWPWKWLPRWLQGACFVVPQKLRELRARLLKTAGATDG